MDDEDPFSWVIRFIQSNTYTLSAYLTSELQANLSYKNKIKRGFIAETIEKTLEPIKNDILMKTNFQDSLLTDICEQETLYHKNYPQIIYSKAFRTFIKLIGYPPFHYFQGGRFYGFCKDCWKLDIHPYIRKNWRVPFIATCIKHNKLFIYQCEQCQAPFKF